jgi:hypothetical protein
MGSDFILLVHHDPAVDNEHSSAFLDGVTRWQWTQLSFHYGWSPLFITFISDFIPLIHHDPAVDNEHSSAFLDVDLILTLRSPLFIMLISRSFTSLIALFMLILILYMWVQFSPLIYDLQVPRTRTFGFLNQNWL